MSYSHCTGGRQQTCPQILRADGIGFFLLIVLALIVSADSHGKCKSDDEAEKRQGSGQDNFKVLAGLVIKFVSPRAEQDPTLAASHSTKIESAKMRNGKFRGFVTGALSFHPELVRLLSLVR